MMNANDKIIFMRHNIEDMSENEIYAKFDELESDIILLDSILHNNDIEQTENDRNILIDDILYCSKYQKLIARHLYSFDIQYENIIY